ncbi:MAG: NFACT family protein [Bacilli bacterium]|nr:NFACT family protein [Bacilli bacterium]
MSMDGRFIFNLGKELDQELKSGRIQKIYQLSKTDFLFIVRTPGKTRQLYISLSTSLTRIHLTELEYDKPDNPGGFCMLLRKYLEGGFITDIGSVNNDRIVGLGIENHNDIGDLVEYKVYMEILGRYANLILVDAQNKIIDAYKHVSPFEDKDRTIERGATYQLPEDGKLNPDDINAINNFFENHKELVSKDLVRNIRGFSPLLADHFLEIAKNTDFHPLDLFTMLMNQTPKPTLAHDNDKTQFYYLDVFPNLDKINFDSISKLLDAYFSVAGRLERNRQISKHLIQFVKRELDRNKNKLEKLANDLDRANKADIYRIKGNIILEHQNDISKGSSEYTAFSYETNMDVQIALDQLLSPIQNANQYFRKYRKYRNSLSHINEQIRLTKTEIEYFSLLQAQIDNASPNDLEEIKQELIDLSYLRKHSSKTRRKQPNYEAFIDQTGIEILLGKNNLQNEYLTHKLARSNEWWFHVQGHHGAHVVAKSETDLTETTIRTAANLAACYSAAKMSASVPVDYTRIKYVKKVPGTPGSFVTYTNQKTIYIDPDCEAIATMTKKRK